MTDLAPNVVTHEQDSQSLVLSTRGETCLMHGMGDHLGVDVDRAASSGIIDPPELQQMVTRCRQCTQHDACILWMVRTPVPQDRAPWVLSEHPRGSITSCRAERQTLGLPLTS